MSQKDVNIYSYTPTPEKWKNSIRKGPSEKKGSPVWVFDFKFLK